MGFLLFFPNSFPDIYSHYTIAVVRQGPTSDRTAFSKRLWRLLDPSSRLTGGPLPRALLAPMPDEARLRQARRLTARSPGPAYLALEDQVEGADADDPI